VRNWRIAEVLIASFTFACSSVPPNRSVVPPTPTPSPINGEAVQKNTNVNFSTYSREWPVGWQWIDPDEHYVPTPHDVKMGVLHLVVPKGKNLYGENQTAPRYLKPIAGDFQIETRVKAHPALNYQGAGLLIYIDENTYLRFERAYGGPGGGASGIYLSVRGDGDHSVLASPATTQTESDEVDLRLIRSGNVFTALWREGPRSEWRKAGEYPSEWPPSVLAGLVACNTASEFEVSFGYIRLELLTTSKKSN
jgi:regulation of enolase protein 1 (concanavalin A-like superfamily)